MVNQEKAEVGRAAVDEVRPGMVLGLGTGSTVYFFLEELGRRVHEGLDVVGLPTSDETAELSRRFGIPLTSFEEHQTLDLTVDGADEVDPQLRMIKGAGGALLREKIVATAAKRRLYIVDSGKVSARLGDKSLLAVEVIPFAWKVAERGLRQLGCEPFLRMPHGQPTGPETPPYKTDNGNYILDCDIRRGGDPTELERAIDLIPGVIENGLFIGIADAVLVGYADRVERLTTSAA